RRPVPSRGRAACGVAVGCRRMWRAAACGGAGALVPLRNRGVLRNHRHRLRQLLLSKGFGDSSMNRTAARPLVIVTAFTASLLVGLLVMLWVMGGVRGVTTPAAIGGPFQLTDQSGAT